MRIGACSCPERLGSHLEGRCGRFLVFHAGEYDARRGSRPPGVLERAIVMDCAATEHSVDGGHAPVVRTRVGTPRLP